MIDKQKPGTSFKSKFNKTFNKKLPHNVIPKTKLHKNLTLKSQQLNGIGKIPSKKEIEESIQLLKENTPGITGIPTTYYKKQEKVPQWLYKFIRYTYLSNTIPDILKINTIIPIPKFHSTEWNKHARNPDKYRPISMQNTTLKIIDGITKLRLDTYCKAHDLIHDWQGGFRENTGTTEQLLIYKLLHERNPKMVSCFMDLEKAYDTVWRDGLFHKLQYQYNMPIKFINYIKTMYTNTRNTIKTGGEYQSPFISKRGLPQGALSSPILFNLYINDLMTLLQDTGRGVNPEIQKNKISALLFADDISLLATSWTNMKYNINITLNWAKIWNLKFGLKKCKLV